MTAADGRGARDAAMRSAHEHRAAGQDRAVIDQALRHLASLSRDFTADDLRGLLPQVAGPLIGARILAASKARLIERIGDRPARHAEAHARRLSVWRGTRPAKADPQPPTAHDASPTPPTRRPIETTAAKARRLLTEGRVRVLAAALDGRVQARVHGDAQSYGVHRDSRGRWYCTCDAGRYGVPCSHRAAVQLVAVERTSQ